MGSIRTFAVAVLVLWLAPSSALAQRNLEISPFAGYRFGGSGDIQLADSTDVPFDFDSGFAWGATADLTFHEGFQFEFMWDRQHSALNVGGEKLADAKIDYIQGGVVLMFRGEFERFRPFIAGTIGASTLRPDSPDADSASNFAASLGIGLKAYMSQRFGFRVEFRGFTSQTDLRKQDSICGIYACAVGSTGVTVWQGDLRGGLIIAF